MKKIFNYKRGIIKYTILFCIISLVLFIPLLFFNKSLIYGNGDAFHQHFLIFNHYIALLKDSFLNLFTIDWTIGLGSDIIGQFGYYIIGDIFAYLGLFFPKNMLDFAYSFLIFLRLYFIGVSFYVYASHHKKSIRACIIGSIIYVFSSFALQAGIFHPYFLNAAIIFPLFILAIEKLIDNDKILFFSLMVFWSFVNNFYFAYKIVILAIIYALIHYFCHYKLNTIKKLFVDIFWQLKKALFGGLIGVFMSGIVLLPVIYTFFSSSRIGSSNPLLSYDLNYYKTLLLGLTSSKNIYWATIGTSSICLFAIPYNFINFKKYKVESLYFSILCLMLLFPFFGSMMNGFSYPTHRWTFAFVFIVSIMDMNLLNDKLHLSHKELTIMSLSSLVYIILLIFFLKLDIFILILIAFLFMFNIVLWLCVIYKSYQKKVWQILINTLIVFNVIFLGIEIYYLSINDDVNSISDNFLSYNYPYYRYQTIDETMKSFSKAIKKLKKLDTSFYRVALAKNNINNLSLLYNYDSFSEYLSLANGNVANMSYYLDNIDYSISKPLKQLNNRTIMTTLLSTKYYMSNQNDVSKVPYGYEIIFKEGDTVVFKNMNYAPILTNYDTYIDSSELTNINGLTLEKTMLENALVDQTDIQNVKRNIQLSDVKEVDYNVSNDSTLRITDNIIHVDDIQNKLILEFDSTGNSEVYLCMNNLDFEPVDFNYDFSMKIIRGDAHQNISFEDKYKSQYYVDRSRVTINTGIINDSNEKEKIEISFNKEGNYKFDSLQIKFLKMNDYSKHMFDLSDNIQNVCVEQGKVDAKVYNDNPSIVQLSTGYSNGWTAFIDSKETKTFQCNYGLIGIEVPSGEHNIQFKYRTPFIKEGAILSFLGFCMSALITTFKYKVLKK